MFAIIYSSYTTVAFTDIEPPKVVTCDGPETKDSYIFTKEKTAFVKWETPTFTDNSGTKVSTTLPAG